MPKEPGVRALHEALLRATQTKGGVSAPAKGPAIYIHISGTISVTASTHPALDRPFRRILPRLSSVFAPTSCSRTLSCCTSPDRQIAAGAHRFDEAEINPSPYSASIWNKGKSP